MFTNILSIFFAFVLGAMFAALTATEAIATVIGNAIFNSLYSVFVKIGSGEKIFLLPAGLALITFPII